MTTSDNPEHFTPLTPEEIEARIRERTVDKLYGAEKESETRPDIRTMYHVWQYRKYKNLTVNVGRPTERIITIELYVSQQNPRFFVEYQHNPVDGEKGWETSEIDFEIEEEDEEDALYVLRGIKFDTPLEACADLEERATKAVNTTEVPMDARPLTSSEKAACMKSLLDGYYGIPIPMKFNKKGKRVKDKKRWKDDKKNYWKNR